MSEVTMPERNENTISREKRLEKIVDSNVKIRKKSFGRKLQETFLTDDMNSVKKYILLDVIIPAIKETISEIINKGTDMILYGDVGHNSSNKNGPKVSYYNYSQQGKKQSRKTESPRKGIYDYQDIIFENRGTAEGVLDEMISALEKFPAVTVADLYDSLPFTVAGQFTDNSYGWTNLSSAGVKRVRGGYILDLPRPIYLDD